MNHLVNEIVSIRFKNGQSWVTTLTEIFNDRVYVWDVLMNGIVHEGHSAIYLAQIEGKIEEATFNQKDEYRKHTEVPSMSFQD